MNSTVLALALLAPAAPPAPAQPDVKETVRTGLKWLAEKQKDDGSWESLNDIAPTATTAHAGLALLMEGSTPSAGRYAPQVRKTVDWAIKSAAENGRIGSNGMNEMFMYVQTHAQALMFLASAYDVDDDPARRKRTAVVLAKAVTFLADIRTSRGAWGFVAAREGSDYDDAQSTALALQALATARKAGIDVPNELTDKGFAYLARATNAQGGVVYTLSGGVVPRGNDGQPGISAHAAAGALLLDARPARFPQWVGNAAVAIIPQQYYASLKQGGGVYSLAMLIPMARVAYAVGDTGHKKLDPNVGAAAMLRWSAVRAPLFKTLKELQKKDGSWDEISFGPAYFTAQALIVLQLENEMLPAFAR
jgi:hypothetical protein